MSSEVLVHFTQPCSLGVGVGMLTVVMLFSLCWRHTQQGTVWTQEGRHKSGEPHPSICSCPIPHPPPAPAMLSRMCWPFLSSLGAQQIFHCAVTKHRPSPSSKRCKQAVSPGITALVTFLEGRGRRRARGWEEVWRREEEKGVNRRKERRFGKIYFPLVLGWRGIGPSFSLKKFPKPEILTFPRGGICGGRSGNG